MLSLPVTTFRYAIPTPLPTHSLETVILGIHTTRISRWCVSAHQRCYTLLYPQIVYFRNKDGPTKLFPQSRQELHCGAVINALPASLSPKDGADAYPRCLLKLPC